ncbi:protein lava lamp [Chironomus tepperi]|uniref:protein lava lamp n=1 Tax=Chironomus tepperi TaxID=113505 RepID=UPI00391FC456
MSDQQEKAPPDFSSLSENLSQQQAKISALKELVRQSEQQHGKNTASAQEKVKNIAQRLSNLKSKATRSKINRSSSEMSEDFNMSHIEEEELDTSNIPSSSQLRARSETPGSEKISLLRKQMELNRMKMAERENKSKEIEQMVTQLRSKFETSQMSLERSVELGRSMGDLSGIGSVPSMILQSQNRSFTISDVSQQQQQSSQLPVNFENERIKFLEKRTRDLETELSIKENITESDVIQNLETKILDLEECVREKESIIEARTKAVSLLTENLSKKKKDVVDSLEETKVEMFKMQETFLDAELTYKKEVSKLSRVITEKSDEIKNLNEKCEILEKSRYDLTLENSELKAKLEDVQDYSTKISELNKLNETLQKRISTLESQKYEFITAEEIGEAKEAEEKIDSEKESNFEELMQKLKDLEESIKEKNEEIEKLQEDLQEKTIEVTVVNANMTVLQEKFNSLSSKPLFSDTSNVSEESHAELAKLKQQLDESNKNMIKTKLKMKQMQKQIDASQKSSDSNQEITRLNEEIQTLTQKVAELEEEKGSYQLQLVGKDKDDLETKLKVLETTCQNQTAAIQLLEEQKMEISDDLIKAKQEIETIKSDLKVEDLEKKIKELEETIQQITEEKEEINIKMNRYLNENMELLDKLEKLSKGSSAESIEMVNLLTAQEKLEIEEYHKEESRKDEEVPVEISQELNESLRSLRLESSELMEKIELFTIERREVLGKLDSLTIENQVLSGNIEHIQEEKAALLKQIEENAKEKEEFEKLITDLRSEKDEMSQKLLELSEHRTKLQEEINKLVKDELSSISPHSSPVKTASHDTDQSDSPKEPTTSTFDREACEKLLKQLDSEIQNLNKNKDKNQKLKISKKLSDNAKNVHAMMTNLLIEFYKNLDDCKQLREDLEKVKILLNNVSSDKNSEEVQNLQKLLNENAEKLNTRNAECEELQNKLDELQQSSQEAFNLEIENAKSELKDQMNRKDDIISSLQDTIDILTNERDHCESEVQKQMSLVADLRKEFDQLCADVKVNNQRLNAKSKELDELQHEFDIRLKTSTNEVEILKTLVAEQKELLINSYQEHELDINQKLEEIKNYQTQIKQMTDELEELRKHNFADQESSIVELQSEIKKLKDNLNECNREIESQKDELLHKQETIDTLNTQIIDLYKTMEENSNKLLEKEDELQYIQEISDSNRDEVRKTHEKLSMAEKTINELREKLSSKINEVELLQHKSVPTQDPERIKQLEAEVQSLDAKNKEIHDKLKKYAANLKKKQTQCSELEEKLAKSAVVTLDPSEFNELKAKVIQYEEQLSNIKVENNKLNESLQKSAKQDEIDDLKWKLEEYDEIVSNKSREIENLKAQLQELSQKCDQVEENSYELQSQVQTLEAEKTKLQANGAIIEKLSKELEDVKKENQEISQKLQETDANKDDKKKMDKLKAAVVQLKHKLADKKKEAEELSAELANLKESSEKSNIQEVEELKKQISELDIMNEKILQETKVAYDNDIGMLKQKIEELESSNRMLMEEKQRKVSLEGQLETFEMTNIELREKVARLEESVASIDAEKNALIREKLTLDRELEEKDEIIGKKLRETEADNCNMNQTIKELNDERNLLLQKMSAMEQQLVTDSQNYSQQLSTKESLNNQLQNQIEQLQQDIKKLHATHEQALAAKHAEIDEMEGQFSQQLQKIESEKKAAQEGLEKANDQIIDFQDEVVRLKDNVHSLENVRADLEREMSWLKLQNDNYTQDQLENEQLRMQLMQSETELENLRAQSENISSNHDAEVLILRQQISDLEAMRSQVSQNQTDDQVMLQNENVKLKELLIEKETELQQKTIQLQMSSVFDAPIQAVHDPFSNLSAAPSSSSKNQDDKLKQANDELDKLRESQMMTNMELDMQSGKIQELLHENRKLQDKVHEMQSMMDNLIRTNVELESVTERQKDDIERKDKEINEIKNEMSALRDHFNQSTQSTDDDKFQNLESELAEKNHAIENLQKILHKYESSVPAQQASILTAPAPPTSTPQQQQVLSTSMFFNDPQPSTSSLFDDPFMAVLPVVEEEIKPKKAYLLFDSKSSNETQTDECWLIEFNENVNKLIILQNQLQMMEQKIMEQYVELEAQRTRICELEEIQKTHVPQKVSQETEIVPVKAYVCYDHVETQTDPVWPIECANRVEELESQIKVMEVEAIERRNIQQQLQQPQNTSHLFESSPQGDIAALEIEDGWGWSGDNVSVEVPLTTASLLSPKSDLEVRLQEQKDIVEKLEQEKAALSDELHKIQENFKKMMKKLKEYQLKIKELEAARRGSSVESNDMDLVIQEELNSQIQKLEARLKEINSEKEKEQLEKDALLKKLDVLSNANDRMLEMKERQDSQMEMYQLKIKDLSQKLHSLEEWSEESQKPVQQTSSTPSANESELTKKIEELNDQIKDMQVDYDELQALLDEEKNNNKILEERLAKINNDSSKDEEIEKLTQDLQSSRTQCEKLTHEVHVKNGEIKELFTKLDQLSNESVNIRVFLDDLKTQVEEKTNENEQLNDRLKKLEVNNDDLSSLYNQSIEQNYRQQIHEFEVKVQNLLGEIDFKSAQNEHHSARIDELSQKIAQLESSLNGKDQEVSQLRAQLANVHKLPDTPQNIPIEHQNERITELEKLNAELQKEKQLMEHELQVLNDQVLSSLEFEDKMKNTVLDLDAKNLEIQMLKATLDKFHKGENETQQKQLDDNNEEIERLLHEKEELERNMKSSIDLLNAQWSQVVEQRGNEVANSWKHHLEMREAEFIEIEASLRGQLEKLSSSPEESTSNNNEALLKMRSIMESQEVEIVSLKEQLAIRSAEYAALSARVDPYHQMSSSMNVSPISSPDSDKVPRSELDLALYMLHQRDMRLEEMTMELVRLLEERDQLQLRLSNAIRQIEEIKKKVNIETAESSDQSTPEKSPPVVNVEDDQLKAKLSELNTVRHTRDKVFADDREQRFMEHMSMFQRDVANIPPEAAARIVAGSDQNQQSPSSVLMNWILGKKPDSP